MRFCQFYHKLLYRANNEIPSVSNLTTSSSKNTKDETLDNDLRKSFSTASQWQLMWWKFRRHRIAVWSLMMLACLYLMALFCEFLAPYPLSFQDISYAYAPLQRIHFISDDGLHL